MKTTAKKTKTTKSATKVVQVENFDIKVNFFKYGWEYITLDFDKTHISFHASCMGHHEPISSLIEVVESLDNKNYPDCSFHWLDEPGVLSFELHRKKANKLSIEILFNKTASFDDELKDGTEEIWHFEINYSRFREKVIQTALQMLRKYGLLGFHQNWIEEDYNFPFKSLLKALGRKSELDKKLDAFKSDFTQELTLLLSEPITGKKKK